MFNNDLPDLKKINEINPICEGSPIFHEGMSFQKYFDSMEQSSKIDNKNEIKHTNFSFIS